MHMYYHVVGYDVEICWVITSYYVILPDGAGHVHRHATTSGPSVVDAKLSRALNWHLP